MPIITLPDGSEKSFDQAISVFEVAKSIGSGLAKATLAGKVNGELVDASFVIEANSTLSIITDKDEAGLEVIRHSSAHLLAQATQMLYPDAQVTIGPVIDNGFFYDFAYKDGFSEGDLAKIEKNMHKLVKQNLKIERSEMSRDDAVQFFTDKGEHYKAEIIASIPAEQTLSLYQQGDFVDLCRGPHVPSTAKLKAFKLMKLAGAYWRGNSDNEMLQRVYGTAWRNKEELEGYLHRLEEAEKRDHRKIGKTQDLFHMQEEAPGMVFWHEKGWTLYQIVEQYMRSVFRSNGYKEVHTPQLIDKSLWEKSGHWDKFGDAMFTTSSENRDYAVKPMNCPAHIQIYNQGLKSYRDLPLRLAEFGSCHRNEPSGTLHGIMRVRNFVQDDGHIFCSSAQIQSEVSAFIDLTFRVYKHFGFENVDIKLSTRPEKRVGSDEVWDRAEAALAQALDAKGIVWELQEGEGAFYGPKIEFVLKDCLEREWQCGTLQVDFSMPQRLDAQFIAEDGSKQTPVMLHRAIVGSLERFIGILIEHYEGAFPSWLAPIQAVILNISEKQADFVTDVEKKLKKQGLRVISDLRNEKIGFKIREHSMQRFPYLLVIGDREMENKQVSVRRRGGEDLGPMSIDAFVDLINQE
ncbi:Threonyl-tRNA synthetase (EC [uncultured Gammaproteobacteria bacterium]|jgi:threonyl-tRNA synthetase|nr:Threonyl-tRNA synthetase (EC 6.1.1.3) [uncultured Gammaproteobacteria bacterium]VVH66293.1 Threonyl-tRNA synthetase (EC [uncultured Gammaproteobacteria bacterium]